MNINGVLKQKEETFILTQTLVNQMRKHRRYVKTVSQGLVWPNSS